MTIVRVAIAWLRREDWPQWLTIDANFHPDYDRWLKRSEAAMERAKKNNRLVEKVTINPDKFVEWSHTNGGKVDARARARYAAFVLNRRSKRAY
jgi:hypothetical protein